MKRFVIGTLGIDSLIDHTLWEENHLELSSSSSSSSRAMHVSNVQQHGEEEVPSFFSNNVGEWVHKASRTNHDLIQSNYDLLHIRDSIPANPGPSWVTFTSLEKLFVSPLYQNRHCQLMSLYFPDKIQRCYGEPLNCHPQDKKSKTDVSEQFEIAPVPTQRNITALPLTDQLSLSAQSGNHNFYWWLMDFIKPNITVELGVDRGYTFFTLGLATQGLVLGVDHMQGDRYTGKAPDEAQLAKQLQEFNLSHQSNLFLMKAVTTEAWEWYKSGGMQLLLNDSHIAQPVVIDSSCYVATKPLMGRCHSLSKTFQSERNERGTSHSLYARPVPWASSHFDVPSVCWIGLNSESKLVSLPLSSICHNAPEDVNCHSPKREVGVTTLHPVCSPLCVSQDKESQSRGGLALLRADRSTSSLRDQEWAWSALNKASPPLLPSSFQFRQSVSSSVRFHPTIDVLHWDAFPEYKSCKLDFEQWSQAVTPQNGVIILHNVGICSSVLDVYREAPRKWHRIKLNMGSGIGILTQNLELIHSIDSVFKSFVMP